MPAINGSPRAIAATDVAAKGDVQTNANGEIVIGDGETAVNSLTPINATASAWNANHLRLGTYRLWVTSTGILRIKNGAPTSETDGAVVGAQV